MKTINIKSKWWEFSTKTGQLTLINERSGEALSNKATIECFTTVLQSVLITFQYVNHLSLHMLTGSKKTMFPLLASLLAPLPRLFAFSIVCSFDDNEILLFLMKNAPKTLKELSIEIRPNSRDKVRIKKSINALAHSTGNYLSIDIDDIADCYKPIDQLKGKMLYWETLLSNMEYDDEEEDELSAEAEMLAAHYYVASLQRCETAKQFINYFNAALRIMLKLSDPLQLEDLQECRRPRLKLRVEHELPALPPDYYEHLYENDEDL